MGLLDFGEREIEISIKREGEGDWIVKIILYFLDKIVELKR